MGGFRKRVRYGLGRRHFKHARREAVEGTVQMTWRLLHRHFAGARAEGLGPAVLELMVGDLGVSAPTALAHCDTHAPFGQVVVHPTRNVSPDAPKQSQRPERAN